MAKKAKKKTARARKLDRKLVAGKQRYENRVRREENPQIGQRQ
jgi:hypothetical protein